jgi:hypothetical protein
MEDVFDANRKALEDSKKARRLLSQQRVEITREYQKKLANLPKGWKESDAVYDARKLDLEVEYQGALTSIENLLRIEDDRQHAAREALAKAALQRNEALTNLEKAAYTDRRAPIGEGIRLTEEDFRKAQKSVPLVAHIWFLAAFVVVVFAFVSSNSSPTPVGIAEFVAALLIVVGFGIRADRYARRAELRAEERLRGEAEGARPVAGQATPPAGDIL